MPAPVRETRNGSSGAGQNGSLGSEMRTGPVKLYLVGGSAAVVLVASGAHAQPENQQDSLAVAQNDTDEVVIVSARRREEDIQSVPVAVSAIPLEMIEATGSYNVGQLTQLTPSVQFFSSN